MSSALQISKSTEHRSTMRGRAIELALREALSLARLKSLGAAVLTHLTTSRGDVRLRSNVNGKRFLAEGHRRHPAASRGCGIRGNAARCPFDYAGRERILALAASPPKHGSLRDGR